jgi:hypothetical protein
LTVISAMLSAVGGRSKSISIHVWVGGAAATNPTRKTRLRKHEKQIELSKHKSDDKRVRSVPSKGNPTHLGRSVRSADIGFRINKYHHPERYCYDTWHIMPDWTDILICALATDSTSSEDSVVVTARITRHHGTLSSAHSLKKSCDRWRSLQSAHHVSVAWLGATTVRRHVIAYPLIKVRQ